MTSFKPAKDPKADIAPVVTLPCPFCRHAGPFGPIRLGSGANLSDLRWDVITPAVSKAKPWRAGARPCHTRDCQVIVFVVQEQEQRKASVVPGASEFDSSG